MTNMAGMVPGFSYLYSVSKGLGKVSEREMSFITEIRVSQCSEQSPAGEIYKNKCFSTICSQCGTMYTIDSHCKFVPVSNIKIFI